MKKVIILLFASAFFFSSCGKKDGASDSAKEGTTEGANLTGKMGNLTEVKFVEDTYDFGVIQEGESVSHAFKFKNTGDSPLLIRDVKVGCGCTVPSYPKEPIAPGEESRIVVQFNSKGKKNIQNKTATVYANLKDGPRVLKFKAEVKPSTTEEGH